MFDKKLKENNKTSSKDKLKGSTPFNQDQRKTEASAVQIFIRISDDCLQKQECKSSPSCNPGQGSFRIPLQGIRHTPEVMISTFDLSAFFSSLCLSRANVIFFMT